MNNMSKREHELRIQADTIRREVMKLQEEREQKEFEKLKGKCFKYHNCYSLPKDDSERWWLYARIVRVEGGSVYINSFQTDKDGLMTAEFDRPAFGASFTGGGVGSYRRISRKEFNVAKKNFCNRLLRKMGI